jgi:predicted RND superfamily exporter protein
MHIERAMMKLSTARPTLTVFLTLVTAALLALVLVRIKVETNPVHILPADNPARLFQQQAHKDFGLHDMVMIGVINTRDKDGVFNPGSLKKIVQLSQFASRILNLKQPGHQDQ